MTPIHIRIFYPADPFGVVPGGIDTFIRGTVKWAPADLSFSLVGISTDPAARPVGRWTRCRLGDRSIDVFPVLAVADAGQRGRVPLSLRYTLAVWQQRAAVRDGFEVFDFHRPEPSLLFGTDRRPKNAFFHQDPDDLRQIESDIVWRRAPGIYQALEARAMAHFASVWCVRQSGVETLKRRYPAQADAVRFTPTWVDGDVFHRVDDESRRGARRQWAQALDLDAAADWIVTVGRLDTQKDPALMLAAFTRLCRAGRNLAWLVVGDGVLRGELERDAAAAGLAQRVRFVGLRSPDDIAELMGAADVYALSSAYEGMPMALLEALGCGLPVAVTDVGEVRRVVRHGINGAVAASRDEAAFAAALADVLDHRASYRGSPAAAAVAEYQPARVLAPVYENYRALGAAGATLRAAASLQRAEAFSVRRRVPVIGVPIDRLDRVQAADRIMQWAVQRDSRSVAFCNVHSAVTATREEHHRLVLGATDLVLPDGAPIAWTVRLKTRKPQPRVDGPDMMWRLCGRAQAAGVKVGLYGSTESTLAALADALRRHFPQLDLAYAKSPPFRPLTAAEDQAVCDDVARSGVGLLFVGLGCAKQERWVVEHRGRIPAVLLGVGAAFDFHAGTVKRAPHWMRVGGLEWLHRLASEPGRLWRRYLVTNALFIASSGLECLRWLTGRSLPAVEAAAGVNHPEKDWR